MNNIQSYKLTEIVLGLEKVLNRYKNCLNKYLKAINKYIRTSTGQEIMKAFQNGVQSNKNNEYSNILNFYNINNDLMLNYNLDYFQKFIEEDIELLEFLNNPILKSISDLADEYKWTSECLLVNIDTYINMFFKLVFNIKNDKNLPKGFNDNPKSMFYEQFPNLKGKLDYEFTNYNELHALRNNIVHNGMIVDKKLLNKLSIKNDDFNCGISVYLPNFNKIILYTLTCLEIVIVVNNEILKNTDLNEQIKSRNISHQLEIYRTNKSK